MAGRRTLTDVIGFGRARGAARQGWQRFETPEYTAAVSLEARLRQEHGDRRAARSVAFEALEQVRRRSDSPRLATLAYRRTLWIASDALGDRRTQGVGPQRRDGSRPWAPGSVRGMGASSAWHR